MVILDPLKFKIQSLLVEGQANPLNQARQRYGTAEDIRILIEEFKKVEPNERRYVLVDFTPFERLGKLEIIIEEMNTSKTVRPVFLVIEETIHSQTLKNLNTLPVLVAMYSEKGDFKKIIGGSSEDKGNKYIAEKDLKENSTLSQLRKVLAEQNLTELLFNPNCLDIPCKNDDPSETVYTGGKYYRKMTNQMLVSCYLNLKEIGKDYKALTSLAYEVVVVLMQYYRRDVDALSTFDMLVTPNNTALFLASSVQAILEKPVISIDRLGPIPALQLHSQKLATTLNMKKVVVIEEVVATGNEVDRTILFLNHMKAELVQIIALYNLEVGMPMLVKPGQLTSLCNPKRELKYVYRSE